MNKMYVRGVDVGQERSHGNKCSVLTRIKYNLISQEKLEAYVFDYMQMHLEITPKLSSPPLGEFKKIMEQLEKGGSKTVVRQQLKILYYGLRLADFLQKPLIIAMMVFVMLAEASVEVWASSGKLDYPQLYNILYRSLIPVSMVVRFVFS